LPVGTLMKAYDDEEALQWHYDMYENDE